MIRKKIDEFDLSLFDGLKDNWALLTVGGKDNYNCMTVSWAALGVMWNKSVGIVFVRPSRHSFDILNNHDVYTLSFFDSSYKKALGIAGSQSGSNTDKFKAASLTPIYDVDADLYYAKEAIRVIKFKKLYYQDMDQNNFLDKNIKERFYPSGDFHRMYVGEITQYLVQEEEENV